MPMSPATEGATGQETRTGLLLLFGVTEVGELMLKGLDAGELEER
jgi:hypothetical protein